MYRLQQHRLEARRKKNVFLFCDLSPSANSSTFPVNVSILDLRTRYLGKTWRGRANSHPVKSVCVPTTTKPATKTERHALLLRGRRHLNELPRLVGGERGHLATCSTLLTAEDDGLRYAHI